MEITLTLDEEVVARARAYAANHCTTLEALMTGYLQRVFELENQIESHAGRARERGGHAGIGYRFNREECYERAAPD